MLSTMRTWRLLSVCALLALVAVSSTLSIEEALHLDGIEAYLHHGVKRQGSGTGSTPSATSTPSPTSDPQPESPTASPPSDTPTTSAASPEPTPTQQTSDQSAEPTPTPTPSNTPTSGGSPSTSLGNTPAPTTPPPVTTTTKVTAPTTRTTPILSTSIQEIVVTVTTIRDGQSVEMTTVSSRTAVSTIGQGTVTDLPDPQNGSPSSSGGLSEGNKKVIGGVVGGVGGAILLGGIALVCWRIWGRKRRVSEDDADLMAGTGAALGDKPHSGASPFQSNLEQYHNPTGRPNAAANF